MVVKQLCVKDWDKTVLISSGHIRLQVRLKVKECMSCLEIETTSNIPKGGKFKSTNDCCGNYKTLNIRILEELKI